MTEKLPPRHCEALAEAIHNVAYLKIFNGEISNYRLPRKFCKLARNDAVEYINLHNIIDCHADKSARNDKPDKTLI